MNAVYVLERLESCGDIQGVHFLLLRQVRPGDGIAGVEYNQVHNRRHGARSLGWEKSPNGRQQVSVLSHGWFEQVPRHVGVGNALVDVFEFRAFGSHNGEKRFRVVEFNLTIARLPLGDILGRILGPLEPDHNFDRGLQHKQEARPLMDRSCGRLLVRILRRNYIPCQVKSVIRKC